MELFKIIYKAIDGLKKSVDGLLKNMDKALKKQDALLFADGSNVTSYRDLLFDIVKDLPFEGTSLFLANPNIEMYYENEETTIRIVPDGYILKLDKVTNIGLDSNEGANILGIMSIDLAKGEGVGSYLFNNCNNIRFINKIINSQNITSLYYCFSGCKYVKKIPDMPDAELSISMDSAFQGCESLVEIPKLNTQKVAHFGYAMSGCYSLEHFPNWDFSNASNLRSMAMKTTNLKEDVELYIPNSIYGMQSTFYESGITGIDLTLPRDGAQGTLMFTSTFQGAKNLKYVNISDTGEGFFDMFLTYSDYMFDGCEELETVTFNTEFWSDDMSCMFRNCKKLTSVEGLGSYYDPNYIFYNCISLESFPDVEEISFSSNSGTCVLFSDDNDGADSALTTISSLYAVDSNRHTNITLIIYASKLTDFGGISKMRFKCLDISKSPLLTRESCNEIFDDADTITHKGSILFHKEAYNRLAPEDIAVATNKGWSVESAN